MGISLAGCSAKKDNIEVIEGADGPTAYFEATKIDENEAESLVKICDETFGYENHVGNIVIKSNPRGSMSKSEIANLHEYLLLYSKKRI